MLKPFDLQGLFIFLCIKVALVTDPACGSGDMFMQSAKFLQAHGGKRGTLSIYGQEANPDTWKTAFYDEYLPVEILYPGGSFFMPDF